MLEIAGGIILAVIGLVIVVFALTAVVGLATIAVRYWYIVAILVLSVFIVGSILAKCPNGCH